MSLRYKLRRKVLGVAISILTVAGGAIYFAGPASANAAEDVICAAYSYSGITGVWPCAAAADTRGYAINFAAENEATETDGASLWHVPTSGYGQISLVAGTAYCMSLDYGDDKMQLRTPPAPGPATRNGSP
jgi:hypothetical protein